MDAVHAHVPKPHDPFVDLVPAPGPSIGIKLTPKHYAYLKISEGCNHRCTFCIIPSLRGDLVSRPVGDVLAEAKALFESGVKELLVISQDTSAYGVDVRYRTGFWDGRPVKTQMLDLCERLGGDRRAARRLGAAALRLSVSACRRGAAADGDRPDPAVPRRAVPAFASRRAAPHEAAGERREEPGAAGALARDLPRARRAQHLHRRLPGRDRGRVRAPARLPARGEDRSRRLLRLFAGRRRHRQRDARACCRPSCARSGVRASWRSPRRCRSRSCARRVGATMQVLVDSAPGLGRKGGVGRSYADAPEIDGRVRLLPPEKASKTLKTGEFTRAQDRRRRRPRPGRRPDLDRACRRRSRRAAPR